MPTKKLRKRVKKTASALKIPLIIIGVVLAIIAVIVLTWRWHSNRSYPFGNQRIHYEVVDTPETRQKGLSGRDSLPKNQGMLFVFDKPGKYCFWMKDMKFPLDIIWLNENKRVVTIQERVQPDSYPKTFCPDDLAQYVIEVNAGKTSQAGVHKGDQLQF